MNTHSDFRAYVLGTARSYPVGAIEISYISIHSFRHPHLSDNILLRKFQDEMHGLQANPVQSELYSNTSSDLI